MNAKLPKKKQKMDLTPKLAINNKSLLLTGHSLRIDFENFKHDDGFVLVP
jgi:hypothetical protein